MIQTFVRVYPSSKEVVPSNTNIEIQESLRKGLWKAFAQVKGSQEATRRHTDTSSSAQLSPLVPKRQRADVAAGVKVEL